MILTKEEIAALMPVLDAGIKAAGVQIFQNNGGILLQSVLAKLQQMVDAEGTKHTENKGESQ